MITNPLPSLRKQFEYYKLIGERAFTQLNEEQINYRPNDESNSIVNIIRHLHGNMLSRWTDCLNSDGEKPGRNRDAEFVHETLTSEKMMMLWEEGWQCFFSALDSFSLEDLNRIIFIRNQGQPLLDAINRQLAHYPYHVGQIVFIGKMLSAEKWKPLSIPKGFSEEYNDKKFSAAPQEGHFTDEFLKSNPQP
jgi:hypothetical protein